MDSNRTENAQRRVYTKPELHDLEHEDTEGGFLGGPEDILGFASVAS